MKYGNSAAIGDLGVTAVDLAVKQLKWIFRSMPPPDVGIDGLVEVVQNGEATGRLVALQIKSGASYFRERSQGAIVYRPDIAHVEYWLDYSLPVLVVLYDEKSGVAFWQLVSEDTLEHKATGGMVLRIPESQRLGPESATEIAQIARLPKPESAYTLLGLDDTSHGLAKRYSATVLVSTPVKSAMRLAVQRIIADMRQRTYARPGVSATVKHRLADIVWVFVYPTLDAFNLRNYRCRAIWVSPGLPDIARPMLFDGESLADGTILDWNDHYEDLQSFAALNTVTKEALLEYLLPLVARLDKLVGKLEPVNAAKDENARQALMQLSDEIDAIGIEAGSLGYPPIECSDLDQRFQELVALAGNAALVFSDSKGTWNEPTRQKMAKKYVEDYRAVRLRFDYELEKIHR